MAPPKLSEIHMLLGEGNRDMRLSLKSALFTRGFREIDTCAMGDQIPERLNTRLVDLLIYDYALPGGDFFDNIQRIRRAAVGRNPFMVMIATLPNADASIVSRVLNSGVDDLIVKPMTFERLFDRIRGLTLRRRPFVAVRSYIGPTRRSTPRPDDKDLIQVPNTLRAKMVEGATNADVQRIVETAAVGLKGKQSEATAYELERLMERVSEFFEGKASESDLKGDLNRMIMVGNDIRSQFVAAGANHLGDLAAMLVALAQRILADPAIRRMKELLLLTNLVAAIKRALTTESEAIETMREIATTIGGFTTRTH